MFRDAGLLVDAHVDSMTVAIHHVLGHAVVEIELLIGETPNQVAETGEAGRVVEERHTIIGRHFA